MVMGAFSGVVFNLEFAEQFGAATPWLSLIVAGLVGGLFSIITQQQRFISVQTMLSAYGIELDGACLGCFFSESSL